MYEVWVVLGWDDDEKEPDAYAFEDKERAEAFFELVIEKYAHGAISRCPVIKEEKNDGTH